MLKGKQSRRVNCKNIHKLKHTCRKAIDLWRTHYDHSNLNVAFESRSTCNYLQIAERFNLTGTWQLIQAAGISSVFIFPFNSDLLGKYLADHIATLKGRLFFLFFFAWCLAL